MDSRSFHRSPRGVGAAAFVPPSLPLSLPPSGLRPDQRTRARAVAVKSIAPNPQQGRSVQAAASPPLQLCPSLLLTGSTKVGNIGFKEARGLGSGSSLHCTAASRHLFGIRTFSATRSEGERTFFAVPICKRFHCVRLRGHYKILSSTLSSVCRCRRQECGVNGREIIMICETYGVQCSVQGWANKSQSGPQGARIFQAI